MLHVRSVPGDLQIQPVIRRTHSVLVASTAFALEGDKIEYRACVGAVAAELEQNTVRYHEYCGRASDELLDSFRAEHAVWLVQIADGRERGTDQRLGSHARRYDLNRS